MRLLDQLGRRPLDQEPGRGAAGVALDHAAGRVGGAGADPGRRQRGAVDQRVVGAAVEEEGPAAGWPRRARRRSGSGPRRGSRGRGRRCRRSRGGRGSRRRTRAPACSSSATLFGVGDLEPLGCRGRPRACARGSRSGRGRPSPAAPASACPAGQAASASPARAGGERRGPSTIATASTRGRSGSIVITSPQTTRAGWDGGGPCADCIQMSKNEIQSSSSGPMTRARAAPASAIPELDLCTSHDAGTQKLRFGIQSVLSLASGSGHDPAPDPIGEMKMDQPNDRDQPTPERRNPLEMGGLLDDAGVTRRKLLQLGGIGAGALALPAVARRLRRRRRHDRRRNRRRRRRRQRKPRAEQTPRQHHIEAGDHRQLRRRHRGSAPARSSGNRSKPGPASK